MRNVPQWINWRPEQRPGEPKPAKVPYDVASAQRIDPHDASRWLPYDVAAGLDPQHVGFVLTEHDPYFCIDLDHAYRDGAWSPAALDVLARFPGAYVEVSYSGDGLHIIARGALPEGYSTRGPGVECYTSARFIAITGTHAQGSPDVDHSAALWSFAAMYLKPLAAPGAMQDWTEGPVPEATPITDDGALISKMLAARASAGVAFGGKASAADLWTGNAAALADVWPSPTDEYDRSAADGALAAHLAFWTGKDCARIERLMRLSKLARPKWDRRGDDYLKRTIIGACSRVQKVYDAGTREQPMPVPTGERAGYQYLTAEAQHAYFAGCCYVVGAHRVLIPNGTLLKPEQFRAKYGGYEFEISAGTRPTKNAFEAFTESRCTQFPKADAMCFRPECEPGALVDEGGLTLVNTYVPAPVTISDADPGPFLELLAKLFPDETDRTIVLSYLAALRQYPGIKFRWCPLIQGVEGNGKGAVMACAEYAVGERYTHKPNAKELGDSGAKFTGWLDRKLLILIEEIYVSDRREVLDALKPLITDDRVEIQHKGADQVTGENRANFILTSNHRDAVLKTRDDRRYAIFYTAQQCRADLERDGMQGDYMPRLWQWLRAGGFAAVAGFLARYAIPDALNPATDCHRAPETTSTPAAIMESRGMVEQEILAAVEEGRQGFAGGWISSIALSKLLSDLRRSVAPRRRAGLMASIGYVPHPALPEGRATTAVMQEGMKRPILYVREGSIPALNITDPNAAQAAYMQAQGFGVGVPVAQGR